MTYSWDTHTAETELETELETEAKHSCSSAQSHFEFGVVSDFLHHYHVACCMKPEPMSAIEEKQVRCVPRVKSNELEAIRAFEEKSMPVLIEKATSRQLEEHWTDRNAFLRRYDAAVAQASGQASGRHEEPLHDAGGYGFTMRGFMAYIDTLSDSEDQPLYLFDRNVLDCDHSERLQALIDDVGEPECFKGRDLFEVLPPAMRPHKQWLIFGGSGSGSLWHTDPNGTCAWNAVAYGRKRWLLCEPSHTPPGVRPEGNHITSPMSISEWFMNFYAPNACSYEVIQRAGEMLFIPRGWWHMALNETETLAVTRNFASPTSASLAHVLASIEPKDTDDAGTRGVDEEEVQDRVSGVPRSARAGLYDAFVERLRDVEPTLLEEALREREQKKKLQQQHGSVRTKRLRGDDSDDGIIDGSNAADEHRRCRAAEDGAGAFRFNFVVDGNDS